MKSIPFTIRKLGLKAARGQYCKVVDKIIVHRDPIAFSKLADQIVTEKTKYLVFDLDKTIHYNRNLGVLLGWELIAEQYFGKDYLENIENKRGKSKFVFRGDRPWLTLRYLFAGLRLWAIPGSLYFMGVKVGMKNKWSKRFIYFLLGEESKTNLQKLTRVSLLKQMSHHSEAEQRQACERVWQRYSDEQVIQKDDLTKLKEQFPQLQIIISSASPKPLLELVKEKMGVDDVFFTDTSEGQVKENASYSKIQNLSKKYPDFLDPQVETVGITDTSHSEDHPWAQYFTKLADVNSPTPFSPIICADSPLKEIHSATLLLASSPPRRSSLDKVDVFDRRTLRKSLRVNLVAIEALSKQYKTFAQINSSLVFIKKWWNKFKIAAARERIEGLELKARKRLI